MHATSFGAFCALHALSPDGQCKTFDGKADGYGRSEAVGAVNLARTSGSMLKLCGTSVNQDGRSASFMAPNGLSQQAVVRAAMQVQYRPYCVEVHGTGTALGDPIEVGALHRVLGSTTGRMDPVTLGALKSLMAHSEGAAGMAGLVKVVHVLKRHNMPSNLHLRAANPKLDLDGFSVVMATQGTGLVSTQELQMGVSSCVILREETLMIVENVLQMPRVVEQVI